MNKNGMMGTSYLEFITDNNIILIHVNTKT